MADAEYPCPECDAETDWRFECPGYPGTWNGKATIMVCQDCSNAIEFFCTNRDCPWWHRTPNNRDDASTMGDAPTWLAQALARFS
jgi:hypothetical protein